LGKGTWKPALPLRYPLSLHCFFQLADRIDQRHPGLDLVSGDYGETADDTFIMYRPDRFAGGASLDVSGWDDLLVLDLPPYGRLRPIEMDRLQGFICQSHVLGGGDGVKSD